MGLFGGDGRFFGGFALGGFLLGGRAGALVLLQGIAEAMRCVMCLRTGEWPARLHDVEETETMAIHKHREDLIEGGEAK